MKNPAPKSQPMKKGSAKRAWAEAVDPAAGTKKSNGAGNEGEGADGPDAEPEEDEEGEVLY